MSITDRKLLAKEFLAEARPMIQLEEFLEIEAAVKRDPTFIEACARRGITDMSLVCVDPWSAGNFGVEGEEGLHLSHAFCWVKSSPHDNLYAHPIEGLNPVVDIKRMEVVRVDDHGITPVPETSYNYDREFVTKTRSHLRPINIEQPDGVSFTMERHAISWHDWSLVVGFNAREAITLHDIRFAGRPVCYRASLAEMVVPYGSPKTPHYRKNVFDIGEYGLGKLANSLTLGCDCLGAIHYLDCWISDINGDPMCIANGICIHEEDDGVLWKHWDFRTDRTEVRRARRLVISSISTVGNYEYGSYWYFYLDGTFEFEMKATGIINTAACVPGQADKYGAEVAPGVVGQIHQHLFCARLDMAVDGDQNSVVECNTVAEPEGPANPYGNAFYLQENSARDRARPHPQPGQRALLEVHQPQQDQPGRPADRLQAGAEGQPGGVPPPQFAIRQAHAVHPQPPVDHRPRPRRALPGRRLHEPLRRLRRPAGLCRPAAPDPERRHRRLARVRAAPPAATGGLSGPALRQRRLQADARGLLRYQPDDRSRRREEPQELPRARRRVARHVEHAAVPGTRDARNRGGEHHAP